MKKISNFVKDNLRNKDFNFNEIKPTLGKDWNENLKLNQVNNIKLGIGIYNYERMVKRSNN